LGRRRGGRGGRWFLGRRAEESGEKHGGENHGDLFLAPGTPGDETSLNERRSVDVTRLTLGWRAPRGGSREGGGREQVQPAARRRDEDPIRRGRIDAQRPHAIGDEAFGGKPLP